MNCNPRIVIALGGNALQSKDSDSTAEAQLEVVRRTCERIADISCAGYEMAVVHGNGPQVGRIVLASETAKDVVPPMPFDVCGAMSQGYIGYHIQQCLHYALAKRNRNVPVVTLATQMVVEQSDPAFQNPTKPIGVFFSESQRDELQKANPDWRFVEDAGRGYRRVVASPEPKRIVEAPAIKALIQQGFVVIGAGGGGIPVVRSEAGDYQSVDAVIDKDLSTALLAREIHADILVITTGVEKVCIHFGKPQQQALDRVDIATMTRYMQEGHFPPGSMLPKIIASLTFLEQGGKEVIITTPECLPAALRGETGTHIIKT